MQDFTRRGSRVALVLALTAAIGCGSSPGSGEAGQLGTGSFSHDCVTASDPVCSKTGHIDSLQASSDLASDDELPVAVAVGAQFSLSYEGVVRNGTQELQVSLTAVSPHDQLQRDVFRIDQPAEAAFLALDSRGVVADFAIVEAVEATELTVWREEVTVERLVLAKGQAASVTVAPSDTVGLLLGGALPYTWAVSQDDLIGVSRLDGEPAARVNNAVDVLIHGLAPGNSRVRVESGALVTEFQVEVTP